MEVFDLRTRLAMGYVRRARRFSLEALYGTREANPSGRGARAGGRGRTEGRKVLPLRRPRCGDWDPAGVEVCSRREGETPETAKRLAWVASAALVIALLGVGCGSLGPSAISRDRVSYQEVLSSTWKAQTLLNLVRLRYDDPPIMVDVASIVNSYTLEFGAEFEPTFGPNVNRSNTILAQGTYTDRPTITYSPVMGEEFARSILTPIPPAAIMHLAQSGYPVDFVFWMCVRRINGVSNQVGTYALRRTADPSFFPLLEALRRIQTSGAFGMRIEKRGDEETAYVFFRPAGDKQLVSDTKLVAQTLGLQREKEYRLVYGAFPRDDQEIAVLSRSMLEIALEVGSYIEVPERDVEETRTVPVPSFGAPTGTNAPPPIHVRHGAQKPGDAYAAVKYRDRKYRGRWWWIDDRDVNSKRLFGFLMILFSMAETGGQPNLPVLTIPAG